MPDLPDPDADHDPTAAPSGARPVATRPPDPAPPAGDDDDRPEPPLGDLMVVAPNARPLWQRVLLLLAAALFVVLGIFGWLVPIVTGLPFYGLALVCLAKSSPGAARFVNRLDAKLPDGARRAVRWRPSWWKRRAAVRAAARPGADAPQGADARPRGERAG